VREVSDPDLEHDLHDLRDAYRGKLRQQLADLAASLREARNEGPATEGLEAARQLAHRLKGTSGSFGLDATSAALARIEEQLGLLLEGAGPDPGAAWTEIEQALGRARADAARAE
jgi:HPt (histidine-containing phosphotransfer) domain-containing protein